MPTRATTAVVRVQDMAVVKCAEELAAARLTGAVTRHGGSHTWGCLRGDMAAAQLIGTGLQRSLWGHSHGEEHGHSDAHGDTDMARCVRGT